MVESLMGLIILSGASHGTGRPKTGGAIYCNWLHMGEKWRRIDDSHLGCFQKLSVCSIDMFGPNSAVAIGVMEPTSFQ